MNEALQSSHLPAKPPTSVLICLLATCQTPSLFLPPPCLSTSHSHPSHSIFPPCCSSTLLCLSHSLLLFLSPYFIQLSSCNPDFLYSFFFYQVSTQCFYSLSLTRTKPGRIGGEGSHGFHIFKIDIMERWIQLENPLIKKWTTEMKIENVYISQRTSPIFVDLYV